MSLALLVKLSKFLIGKVPQALTKERSYIKKYSAYRIYETFVAFDAPLELNVKTQKTFQEKLKLMEWCIITREDALDLLEDTEQEVLAMLVKIIDPIYN